MAAETPANYSSYGFIDEAWIVAYIPGHGFNGPRPWFIGWWHDLSNKTLGSRLVLGLMYPILTLITLIANVANVIIYYRRGVRRDFLILMSFLAAFNVGFALTYSFLLLQQAETGFWELGPDACTAITFVVFIFGVTPGWFWMLVSFERRACLVLNSVQTKGSSIRVTISALFCLLLICVTFATVGIYPYHSWRLEYVSVHGIRNGTPIPLCAGFEYKIAGDFTTDVLTLIYFILIVVAIPQTILAMNYWQIFRKIRDVQRQMGSHSTGNSTIKTDWRRRETFFMKQSLVSFSLFTLFHVPILFSFIFPVFYDGAGPYLQSTKLHLAANVFYIFEMIIGPLIQSTRPGFSEDWHRAWINFKIRLGFPSPAVSAVSGNTGQSLAPGRDPVPANDPNDRVDFDV